MACLTERWNKCIHNYGESVIVSLDISKAFDRVWHSSLLAKIRAIGAGAALTKWIESYLVDRQIRVVLDGFTSDTHNLNSGVPQGSALAPTLFLIFINDLLNLTVNPLYCFADDSTLDASYSFESRVSANTHAVSAMREEMVASLNSDLNIIRDWGKANRVDFNASKTQSCLLSMKTNRTVASVYFDGQNLARCSDISILGMRFNDNLRWTEHIYDIAKNASKSLGFLRRCRKYFSPSDIARIYKAHIRPKLEYNSHIWAGAPRTYLNVLDRIQNRAIRLIGDKSISDMIDSLEHRRNVGVLSLYYRYHSGNCANEIPNLLPPLHTFSRNTRLAARAHECYVEAPHGRTTKYKESFIPRTSQMWNSLPATVFPDHYNLQLFKTNVHRMYRLRESFTTIPDENCA